MCGLPAQLPGGYGIYSTSKETTKIKYLLFNTDPNRDLNITHCVQFFYSSWGEFDHTPGLILNHGTPDALSCGLCPLLSKQGQHKDTHTHTQAHSIITHE